jgi:hypothetical protein
MEETQVTPAQQRVQAGVERLDSHLGPDWPLRIDLSKFRIESGTRCILGQLFGGYDSGRDALYAAEIDESPESCGCCVPEVLRLCRDHGFTWQQWEDTEGLIAEQDALNSAWSATLTLLQVERQPRSA